MEGPYKEYALRFLPGKVRFLLVGESPPFTPPKEMLRYFYNYENTNGGQMLLSSVSYSFLNQKFYVNRDDKEDFLRRFSKQGVFLIDAIYEPINQIKDQSVRRSKIEDRYPQLKKNIRGLRLENSAKILLIHGNVIEAIGQKLRDDFHGHGYTFYDVGFPSYYNDENFKAKIVRAIKDS